MGKILVALGFEKLPEVLKIAQSGHTAWQAFFLFASNYLTYSQDVRVEDVVFLVLLIVAAVVRKLLRGGSLWRALLRPTHLCWTVPVGKQIRNEVRVFGADVEAVEAGSPRVRRPGARRQACDGVLGATGVRLGPKL